MSIVFHSLAAKTMRKKSRGVDDLKCQLGYNPLQVADRQPGSIWTRRPAASKTPDPMTRQEIQCGRSENSALVYGALVDLLLVVQRDGCSEL